MFCQYLLLGCGPVDVTAYPPVMRAPPRPCPAVGCLPYPVADHKCAPVRSASSFFEKTEYHHFYQDAVPLRDEGSLWDAVGHIIQWYTAKHGLNPQNTMLARLQKWATTDGETATHAAAHASHWSPLTKMSTCIWISPERLPRESGVEFCTMLNAAIRADSPHVIREVVRVARTMNACLAKSVRELGPIKQVPRVVSQAHFAVRCKAKRPMPAQAHGYASNGVVGFSTPERWGGRGRPPKCYFFFLTKYDAIDDFSEPPRGADSKTPIFIFCGILRLGHLRGPGVSLRRILGTHQWSPWFFGGEGLARGRAVLKGPDFFFVKDRA